MLWSVLALFLGRSKFFWFYFQVIGGVDTCPLVTDKLVQFSGLLDLSLSLLRKHRVLKNDRTLVRGLDTLAVASSVVLTTKQKQVNKNKRLAPAVMLHCHVTVGIGLPEIGTLEYWTSGNQNFSSPIFDCQQFIYCIWSRMIIIRIAFSVCLLFKWWSDIQTILWLNISPWTKYQIQIPDATGAQ